jgi:SAM-dependent methyltransferase
MSETRTRVTYDKAAYDVFSFEEAQRATLGDLVQIDEDGEHVLAKADDRWTSETAYTVELIARTLAPVARETVLDYGCGAGRVSKALVNAFGCSVVGADQSPSMMLLAERYVGHTRFRAVYHASVGRGAWCDRCDAAVCIFVLQHSICPDEDVRRIHAALRVGGKLLVINEEGRFVPTIERGFINDGVEVRDDLVKVFGQPSEYGRLDPTRVDPRFSKRTWWSVYCKKE